MFYIKNSIKIYQLNLKKKNDDLVYFTTRVLNTSDTSATRTPRVRHGYYRNGTSATRVKNFDSHNDTSENIFSHSYFSYMANERIQEEELPFGNVLLPWQNAFEKFTTKTEVCNHKKLYQKS